MTTHTPTHGTTPPENHPRTPEPPTPMAEHAGQTTHGTTHGTHTPTPPTITPLYEVGGERGTAQESGKKSTAGHCAMCGNAAHAQEGSGSRPHCAHEQSTSRSERRHLINDERSAPPRALVAAMMQVRVQHEFTRHVDFRRVCGCGRRFGPRQDWETHLSEELASVALAVLGRRLSRG